MKKFGLVAVLVTLAVSFSFAATTDNMVVTGTVAQKLSVALPSDVAIGELNTSGATVSLGNANARSNIRSWDLQFKADNGKLTLLDGSSAYDTTQQIKYTFTFNGTGLEGEKISAGTLSTDYADNSVTFARKTTGGASGEDFAISLTYDAENAAGASNTNWVQGTYKDTIYVQIKAH